MSKAAFTPWDSAEVLDDDQVIMVSKAALRGANTG